MSAIHTLKSVFNGGELSPMLDARVDSEKYASGCKELTNFIPSVYGGIKKRPGTELLGFTKNDGDVRLHGFKRNTDTSYVLEFGAGYLRFWKGGDAPMRITAQENVVYDWHNEKTEVKWVARAYAEQDVVRYNGVLHIATQAHAASPTLIPGTSAGAAYWCSLDEFFMWSSSYTYPKYQKVYHPGTGRIYVSIASSTNKEPGVAPFWGSYWLDIIDFEFGWRSGFAYQQGDVVRYSGVTHYCKRGYVSSSGDAPMTTAGNEFWRIVGAYNAGETVKVGDVYYRCHISHRASELFVTDASRWLHISPADALDGAPYEIATPFSASEVFDLQFTQLNDVLFIAHPNHHPKRLSRKAERDWVLEDVPFQYAPSLDLNEERISVQVQFEGVPPFGNPWRATAEYEIGDRVHGIGTAGTAAYGRVYECKVANTAVAASNQPGVSTGWANTWTEVPGQTTANGYSVGQRVTAADIWVTSKYVDNAFNGSVFTCHTAYNPAEKASDEPGYGTSWSLYWNEGTGSTKVDVWTTAQNQTYVVGDKVRSGKVIYECVRNHKPVARAYVGSGKGRKLVQGNQPGVSVGWVSYWRISAADSDLSGLEFALHATEEIFSADDVGTSWLLELGAGGAVEELALPATSGAAASTENNPLFIQGDYTVMSSWTTGNAFLGTITVEESLDGIQWNSVRQFTQVFASEGNILYRGEAPAVGAWYRMSCKAAAATDASKMKLEASSAVIKLPFLITGFDATNKRKAKGKLIMPGDQLPPDVAIGTATSIFRKPAFSKVTGFPRTVTFHDSRLWWGGTRSHPTRIWASHVEDYYIYLGGSLDTDGLDLTLATTEANAIQWMTSFNRALVIGTSGDEWTVDSGDVDAAMTPTNLRAHRRTRYGSGVLPPQITGDALLWLRRGGARLHEFAYVYERDSFSAPDLTLLSEHILRDGAVRQTAFVPCPDPVLWLVNGSSLLGLSYNREHNVTAWHRHTTYNGKFISVASIYGKEGVDELWVVVRRNNVCSIERMEPRTLAYYHGGRIEGSFENVKDSFFIDAARKSTGTYYSSTGKTLFPGYHHLRRINSGGQKVMLLNGQTPDPAAVITHNTDGTLSIDGNYAGQTLVMGYTSVDASMQSMNLEMMMQEGTSQGRKWRLIRTVPNVWRSRGFTITAGTAAVDVPLALETTRILDEVHISNEFQKQLSWGVKSNNPYPCNLLGMVLKLEVTGG